MKREWFRQWFDSPYSALLYSHRDEQEAAAFLTLLLEKLQLPAASRILDMACGNGRHANFLADKGFQVMGIDLSYPRIKSALSANLTAEFYVHDMRFPVRIRYFDLIVNLFTSFGYFKRLSDNQMVIRSSALSLRTGGLLVIDFLHYRWVERNFQEKEHKNIQGVDFFISRTIENGAICSSIKVEDQKKISNYRERVYLFDPASLREMLEAEGMEVVAEFGDYQLQPFHAEMSERFIIISRKK